MVWCYFEFIWKLLIEYCWLVFEGDDRSFWNAGSLSFWFLPSLSLSKASSFWFFWNIRLVVSIIALASSIEISIFPTSVPKRWISDAVMYPFWSRSINLNACWVKLIERLFLCDRAGCYAHTHNPADSERMQQFRNNVLKEVSKQANWEWGRDPIQCFILRMAIRTVAMIVSKVWSFNPSWSLSSICFADSFSSTQVKASFLL